jgi:glucan 1,3-beta-glucosidase
MTQEKLHGVNLGGWLLLEKWMTPSLFEGTAARDEYELLQASGGKERIERHRRTFITEQDFIWLKDNGLNAIRIPVGYWVLENDAPFIAATRELDWAMDMARKYELQVIIDLHGLKGSQNGYDHSGRIGVAGWYKNAQYRRDTSVTLETIANRYKDYAIFWGLQVVNEPKLGVFQITLRNFYEQAYERLAKILKPHTHIIFSDTFTPRLLSGAMGRHSGRVVMDVHLYHMTTLLSQFLSIDWFMRKTTRRGRMLKRLSKTQPIIIGEWSGVMRHETMRHVSQDEQEKISREYIRLQMDIFDTAAGWFYWSYKTESPGLWHFRSQVESGAIRVKTP